MIRREATFMSAEIPLTSSSAGHRALTPLIVLRRSSLSTSVRSNGATARTVAAFTGRGGRGTIQEARTFRRWGNVSR
jgi:hypothetical protein